MKKQRFGVLLLALACLQVKSAETNWAAWLLQSINNNAHIQAQQFATQAGSHYASSMAKPIFNPALETEIEQEGDAFNYRIGLASDIDWWDQQGIRTTLGKHRYAIQQFTLQQTLSEVLSAVIYAQVSLALSEKNYLLATAQVEQDMTLLHLVKAEVAAGEASLTDVAVLNAIMGENIVAENEALAAYLNAQQELDTLLGRHQSIPPISQQFWQTAITMLNNQQIQQLPKLQIAYFEWQQAQQAVKLQLATSKPSPSVAMNIGQQDGTATVAMSVSVPLTFRNNYRDDADEMRQLALAAEQTFRANLQQTQHSLQQQVHQLNALQKRYTLWLSVSGDGFMTQSDTLNNRFASGDLGIADYQGLIQQLRSGMQASIAIEHTFKRSYINYLTTSGQLTNLLQQLATPEVEL